MTVSRMALGRAPIAAKSLTLVRTAATPAPKGSATTSGGQRASPPARMVRPPQSATTAASSPGPVSQSVGPNPSRTRAVAALPRRPGWLRTKAARSVGERATLHQNRRAFTIGKVPQAAFLDLPARSAKARTAGLTHVLDKGLPIDEVRALLPMCAQYVDVWKFGWGVAYLDDTVAEKVALLREWQVLACPGGTLLEIAWAQGRSADCLAWAADCGFDCVEVSNGTVGMPAVEKRALVETAASRFTVLAEVGSKDPQAPVSPHQWAKQARADLSAGARWVVIEGRESGSVGLYEPDGQVRSQLVSALTDAVG